MPTAYCIYTTVCPCVYASGLYNNIFFYSNRILQWPLIKKQIYMQKRINLFNISLFRFFFIDMNSEGWQRFAYQF